MRDSLLSAANMSGFDETILREYLEARGFYVRTRRYFPGGKSGRRTGPVEEVSDFLIWRGDAEWAERPNSFVWFSTDLQRVGAARVFIRPWHQEAGFSPKMLNRPGELAKFIESKIVRQVETILTGGEKGPEGVPRVLVLPAFPLAETQRAACTKLLQAVGIDAVLSFRSILDDVVRSVEKHGVYTKTPALETVRILHSYDLIKDPQLGLF
jgi:hypothetical protein